MKLQIRKPTEVDSNDYIRDWEFGQSDLDELLKIN